MKDRCTMSDRLNLRIENSLPELERVRCEIEKFLVQSDVGGREAYHIQLALDELVTNVILYAYDSQGGKPIDLILVREPGAVAMTLEDEGKPFNPLEAPVPDMEIAPEMRRIGGLGIHFVRKTMDHLDYERKNGKNILHLRKRTT